MAEPNDDRNPVEELAEDFLERFRQGQRPSLSEYTRKYPDLAGDIRDLFPALVMLEDVRPAGMASAAEEAAGRSGRRQKLDRLGDYRILREVGRGGMGIVYEAEQESLGRHVALKILSSHALLDPKQLQRFQREARSAARLHHTNIVPVFGVGAHEELHYYVMQFIHGQGLDQVLEELQRLRRRAGGPGLRLPPVGEPTPAETAAAASALAVARSLLTGVFAVPFQAGASKTGEQNDEIVRQGTLGAITPSVSSSPPLPLSSSPSAPSSSGVHLPGQEKSTLSDSGRRYWASVSWIGIQVAEALAYAHGQGTLHRDIKPSNLLLDTQGVVWVTDFGLAKASDSEDLTHTGDVVGTLRYMAPERFQGKADARSDVYALGLTLYELLTLRPAFDESERDRLLQQVMNEEPPRPRKLNPAVPRDLDTIVCKAIARDPAHRYQSAAELAEDLKRFRDDKPIRARPVSEVEKLWRWCRRNPALATLTTCLLVSLLAGIVGTTLKWHEAEQRRDEAEGEKQKVIRAEGETAKKRDEAIVARNDTRRILAGAMLDKGIALAKQAEVGEGLFWMLEALKTVPEDAVDLVRTIRTNLAGWIGHSHRLHHVTARSASAGKCVFTPDGQRLLVACSDGVYCCDTATGKSLGSSISQGGGLAFSPDGKRLVTRGGKETGPRIIELWDVAGGRRIGEPLTHPMFVYCAAFTPDGKQFVTGCHDGVARVWDSDSGKLIRSLDYERKSIRRLALSPDGKVLAAAYQDRSAKGEPESTPATVSFRNWSSGTRLGRELAHKYAINGMAFAPDGKHLVTAGTDATVRIWDVAGGKPIGQPMRHPSAVQEARFTPDARLLLTGGQDGVVRTWDAVTGQQLIGTLAVSRFPIDDLAINGAGTMLAVTRADLLGGQIDLCALARNRSRQLVKGNEPYVKSDGMANDPRPWWHRSFVSFSPDVRHVVSGGNGFASVYTTADGVPAYLALPGPHGPLRHIWPSVDVTAFSPDGRRFATACRPVEAAGEVRLWDAVSGGLIALLPHTNYIAAMTFSPDGKILATGGYDRFVHLWDTATGKRLGDPFFQGDIVVCLDFSPDGKRLAVARTRDYSGKESVIVYDVATGRQRGPTIQAAAHIMRFAPDGKRIVMAIGSSIRIWDPATGDLQAALTESGGINTLIFSPDGKMTLAGATDGTLRLRDVATGKLVGAPMIAQQRVTSAAFSPDPQGKLIVAGYGDGSARLWDRATEKPLGPPVLHSRAVSAVAFSADGRSFVTTDVAGDTRSWPVPAPTAESIAALTQRLPVHTGLEMVEGQAVVPIAPKEWERLRRQLLSDAGLESAAGLDSAPLNARQFHDARARDAEQDGLPYTAVWHLDRLLAEESRKAEKGWLFARRARAHAGSEEFTLAEADAAQALAHVGRDQFLNWCRHCIVAAQDAEKWQAALWYLDRVIAGATPVEWQLYADRARVHEKLGHAGERDADLARAVEHGADSSFLLQLTNDYAGRGLWDKAKDTLTNATARGPVPLAARHWDALFALRGNEPAKYRGLCDRLLKRIGPDPPPELANGVAWVCALAPDGVADYARATQLAELAVKKADVPDRANVLNTLGAVLYRAGRFKEAVAQLDEGIRARDNIGVAQDWIFLAMAHHRLGAKEKAHAFLDKVAKHQAGLNGRGWDYLELEVLRGEAQALIEGAARGGKKKG